MRKSDDENSKATKEVDKFRSGIYQCTKTLGLSVVGTAALVGAHHLGRKQYNDRARLMDYVEGLVETIKAKTAVIRSDISTDNSTETATVSWVSGVADLSSHEFAVVGIDNERKICWQTAMPERVHDILIQPQPMATPLHSIKAINSTKAIDSTKVIDSINPINSIKNSHVHVAVMGRRPSERFWVLQVNNGKILHSIKAEPHRHFYGHACYSLAGDLLYVTENNTLDFSGIIGIYDVATGYKKIGEFATQGIGPHEIVMHPDGETLVIANGGIKTEKASREELNLDSMQPSLVYLDRHEGKLLQQVYPEHNQMSVRHLAMHDNGTVLIGIQFQGERHLNVPMVLSHRLGQSEFTPLQMADPNNDKNVAATSWHRFYHYIASVAVDSTHNLVCATSPIGGCAAVFDLETVKLIEVIELADCAGAAVYPLSYVVSIAADKQQSNKKVATSFLVSDGQGMLSQIKVIRLDESFSVEVDKVQQPYAFDNHLNVIESI